MRSRATAERAFATSRRPVVTYLVIFDVEDGTWSDKQANAEKYRDLRSAVRALDDVDAERILRGRLVIRRLMMEEMVNPQLVGPVSDRSDT